MKNQELTYILEESINKALIQVIISNPTSKEGASKVKLRPVLIKDSLLIQETRYVGTQVLHTNLSVEEAISCIEAYMDEDFKQCLIQTEAKEHTILVSKKGKITIKSKQKQVTGTRDLEHNRTKQYLLEAGERIPFLVDLGITTLDGKIVKSKYDKFRQINKYLEIINDIVPKLPTDDVVRIIDFGCGKSYLTFALYHYLHVVKGFDIEVIGLDLKADVIKHCNELAVRYGFEGLRFEMGDIAKFEGCNQVDMVVTLHACDTATDYAIEKAVQWGAQVILCVPCCQHEVNKQIKSDLLAPVLKYGILKERMSALITDGIRANVLEQVGYETQILEFIDMEHTPKNLLIRATKKNGMRPKGNTVDIKEMTGAMNIHTTLQGLFE
ncbi:MAG: SAM-dependent methyltransferase [Lachnospiraceae bacterium]